MASKVYRTASSADGELSKTHFVQVELLELHFHSRLPGGRVHLRPEEIFGPVLSILSYDDADELAARANDTEYGLAACIWTKDLTTAHTLAASMRAGTVFVNMLPFLDPAAPWGGFGASGWGREMSSNAIDEFTETKGVWINLV